MNAKSFLQNFFHDHNLFETKESLTCCVLYDKRRCNDQSWKNRIPRKTRSQTKRVSQGHSMTGSIIDIYLTLALSTDGEKYLIADDENDGRMIQKNCFIDR